MKKQWKHKKEKCNERENRKITERNKIYKVNLKKSCEINASSAMNSGKRNVTRET